MAGKPIATVGSMHMCPMCSGYIPHIGGPVTGPGMPGVTINGQAVAVMGDMCTCIGPPDVIVQGCPGITINGVPVASVGCMTAHGGQITSGIPGVTIGSKVPTPAATMPIAQIPFPEIRLVDKLGAAMSGNSANLKQAQGNIEAIQRGNVELEPNIYNVRWVKESTIVKNSKELKEVTVIADVINIDEGETVDFTIARKRKSDGSEQIIELSGTVVNGTVEAIWEIEEDNTTNKGSNND